MNDSTQTRFQRRSGLKTYSHFKNLGRMPSEYEVVSSRLTYNTKGFEVHTPVTQWYERYRDASPLKCSDWEKFYDPRQTVYRRYNEIQYRQENYVDFTFERIESDGYDKTLDSRWLDVLRLVLGPYRYPAHAMQMIAAYFCHIAPSSRITNAGAFQGADAMRLVQRIAYRETQLNIAVGGFGDTDREKWENHPVWQPLRECIEKMLTAWDWAESLVALNVVLKPQLDDLLLVEFSELAAGNDDRRLGDFLYSFGHDAQWHRDWTRAFIRMVLEDTPANEAVLGGWIQKWLPLVRKAIAGFAPVFEKMPAKPLVFKHHQESIESRHAMFLDEIGLGSVAAELNLKAA